MIPLDCRIVYVLIPVFNRVELTKRILQSLQCQKSVNLKIIVIDDGSTDGTSEVLKNFQEVEVLKGNGDLWWAGAINLGLLHIQKSISKDDFFLFINNDVEVDENFVSSLISASDALGGAAVGSVIKDKVSGEITSIGAVADLKKFKIYDLLNDLKIKSTSTFEDFYLVRFLSGRGAIYPASCLIKGQVSMKPSLLPHYHADYEFSEQVTRLGIPLIVSTKSNLYSTDGYGNERRFDSIFKKYFSRQSIHNPVYRLNFYLLVGTWWERITFLPRSVAINYLAPTLKIKPLVFAFTVFWLFTSRFFSSKNKAKFLAGLERRNNRRIDFLTAYFALSLYSIKGKKILLVDHSAVALANVFTRFKPEKMHFWVSSNTEQPASRQKEEYQFIYYDSNPSSEEESLDVIHQLLSNNLAPNGLMFIKLPFSLNSPKRIDSLNSLFMQEGLLLERNIINSEDMSNEDKSFFGWRDPSKMLFALKKVEIK
jgi:GT2 family glycosyltransferase